MVLSQYVIYVISIIGSWHFHSFQKQLVTHCVKWPHDYGRKWLQVEIFCTNHFRKRSPILHPETLAQTIQESKCPLFITDYSSQTRGGEGNSQKSDVMRKQFIKKKSTQTEELWSSSGKSCLPLLCPSSKNLLYKHKCLLKVSCLSQQLSFAVIHRQFLQHHLYHWPWPEKKYRPYLSK